MKFNLEEVCEGLFAVQIEGGTILLSEEGDVTLVGSGGSFNAEVSIPKGSPKNWSQKEIREVIQAALADEKSFWNSGA